MRDGLESQDTLEGRPARPTCASACCDSSLLWLPEMKPRTPATRTRPRSPEGWAVGAADQFQHHSPLAAVAHRGRRHLVGGALGRLGLLRRDGGPPVAPRVGVRAWMAFQVRATAVWRSVSFLTGLRRRSRRHIRRLLDANIQVRQPADAVRRSHHRCNLLGH